MQSAGLRETKKSQTRELIAQTAADLFAARGFDAVTVEAIADAANVSKKTVFNYFPTKEDLVFARADDRRGGLLTAVHERADGVTVLESFRSLCLNQANALPRLRASAARSGAGFFELVEANPGLQRKAHELTAGLIRLVADALAAEAGKPADDAVVVVVATTLVAAQRTLYQRLRELAATPASDATVIRRHRRDTDRVFEQLRAGLATYPLDGR
jgi:AcrR family transcriptional regulator